MAEKNLVMRFLNSSGKKVSIKVVSLKDAVSDTEVNSLMDAIIAKNIFTTSGGDLVSKDSAEVVDTSVTEFKIA
jgi:hypothetical protein